MKVSVDFLHSALKSIGILRDISTSQDKKITFYNLNLKENELHIKKMFNLPLAQRIVCLLTSKGKVTYSVPQLALFNITVGYSILLS